MAAGVKRSNIELNVLTKLKTQIKNSSKKIDEILLNNGYDKLSLYLSLPEKFDVKGPDFDEFCKKRMMFYNPECNIQDYLETTIVNPQLFEYDIVVTYARKNPVFIELNNFYHYETKDKMNSLKDLAHQIATDYAKEYFIRNHGYKLLWVRTLDTEISECVKAIYKEI